MAIKKDLFKDLLSIQERMYRLFEDALSRDEKGTPSFNIGRWSPAIDLYETDEEIILIAELAGLSKKEIEIKIIDNNLIIKGERKTKRNIEEEIYHCIERSFGSFKRTFSLPVLVKKDQIKASFINGVLKLNIPKEGQQRPQKIKIQVE